MQRLLFLCVFLLFKLPVLFYKLMPKLMSDFNWPRTRLFEVGVPTVSPALRTIVCTCVFVYSMCVSFSLHNSKMKIEQAFQPIRNLPCRSGNIRKSGSPGSPPWGPLQSLLDGRSHCQPHHCCWHCCSHCPEKRQLSHPKLFGN